jgi:hypothetical protein
VTLRLDDAYALPRWPQYHASRMREEGIDFRQCSTAFVPCARPLRDHVIGRDVVRDLRFLVRDTRDGPSPTSQPLSPAAHLDPVAKLALAPNPVLDGLNEKQELKFARDRHASGSVSHISPEETESNRADLVP